MNDIRIGRFVWFRPVARGSQLVCFRAGAHPLLQDKPPLARDLPGSPVCLPLMTTPSWTPPNGGFYHFGRFEAMIFLMRLYIRFATYLDNPDRADKYNLKELIKKNWNLDLLQGRKPKILLGDMTGHAGFAVPGHETHKTGQQIDIHYIPEDGSSDRCYCFQLPGFKEWHLGLNALLLHCILEAGASWVVTDSKVLRDTARVPKGVTLKGSTLNSGALVHQDHFHVDILQDDPRAAECLKSLKANKDNKFIVASLGWYLL